MRRNLRLDWRALALLGALLTIMIKWPGEAGGKGLVHAMPTNSNRVQLTEPTSTIMTLLQMKKNVSAYHNNVDIKAKDRQHNELILLPAINVESTTAYYQEHADETTTTTMPITTNNQLKKQTNINNKIKNIVGYKNVTSGYKAGNTITNYTNEFQHKNSTATKSNAENPKDEKDVEYSISQNSNNNEPLIDKFQFTSSHHIAAIILSRTERSAVVVDNGNSNIVRRSPDITHTSNNFVGGLKSRRLNISRNNHNNNNNSNSNNKIINSNHNNINNNNSLDRNERSTISHLSGPSRKIQLFIKNRYLQLLPDGTINGTQDEYSEYTILQRSTVDVGRIKIQSVATCLYLCMDACGAVFGSTDFTDDCIFNENMEQHNYNTYSSTYNSNTRRTFYLALNRHGEPRRLQIPPTRSLGKLATYTNAITETVPQERVEKLIAKNFGENRVKHGIRQLCDTGKPLIELIDRHNFKARPMCNPNSSSNSNSNGSKNSNSNSHTISSLNSQLNNLPAANDKISDNIEAIQTEHHLNNNSKINRHENNTNHTHQHSTSDDNQNSFKNSSSNSSSFSSSSSNLNETEASSIRKNQSMSGHIRNSTMSSSGLASEHHSDDVLPKKKKRRKCRPYEDEQLHNCRRGPAALRKHNHNNANKNKMNKNKLPKCKDVNPINAETAVPCHGPKRNGQKKMQNGNNRKQKNQRGDAVQAPGKKSGRKGNAQPKKNKHNKKNNAKRGNKLKKEQEFNQQTNISLNGSGSLKNLERTTHKYWSTTVNNGLESTTAYVAVDAETSTLTDRAEREQRNVPIVNSMEATDDTNEDLEEQESENVSEEVGKYENEDDDGDSNTSYEELQAQFTGGSDDILYYDQLDL